MNAESGGRLLALDVMRGGTMAMMILVNMAISPALSWGQLLHSVWDGFTLADAIYPTFLFVVGASMALSFGVPGRASPEWPRIWRRAAMLVACGLFVSNFPFGHVDAGGHWIWQTWPQVRLPGVLQRIGLAYLLAAAALRAGGARAAWLYCAVMLPLSWLVALHWGDFTLAGSAVLKVDLAVFGPGHLYHGERRPFDPEGLLGSFPATVNLLAGYLVLRHLRLDHDRPQVLKQLMLAGLVLVAVALAWAQVLPINKKLWSASYALLAIGVDSVLLALLVWFIDQHGWRKGLNLFEVIGRNPLALYMLAEALMSVAWTVKVNGLSLFMVIFNTVFAGAVTGRIGSFAFGLAMVGLCWAIGGWMDRRRVYVRL